MTHDSTSFPSAFTPPAEALRARLASSFVSSRLKAYQNVVRVLLVTFDRGVSSSLEPRALLGAETSTTDPEVLLPLTKHIYDLFRAEFPDVPFEGVLSLSTTPDTPESRKAEFYRSAVCIYQQSEIPDDERERGRS